MGVGWRDDGGANEDLVSTLNAGSHTAAESYVCRPTAFAAVVTSDVSYRFGLHGGIWRERGTVDVGWLPQTGAMRRGYILHQSQTASHSG